MEMCTGAMNIKIIALDKPFKFEVAIRNEVIFFFYLS